MASAAAGKDGSSTSVEGGGNTVGGTAPMQAPGAISATGLNLRAGQSGSGRRSRAPALSPMWQPQLRTPAPGLLLFNPMTIPGSHSAPGWCLLWAAQRIAAAPSGAGWRCSLCCQEAILRALLGNGAVVCASPLVDVVCPAVIYLFLGGSRVFDSVFTTENGDFLFPLGVLGVQAGCISGPW